MNLQWPLEQSHYDLEDISWIIKRRVNAFEKLFMKLIMLKYFYSIGVCYKNDRAGRTIGSPIKSVSYHRVLIFQQSDSSSSSLHLLPQVMRKQ